MSSSSIQARLEAHKMAKESKSADEMKAELEAKMASAAVKKDVVIKSRVESATAVIEKAKILSSSRPAGAVEGEEKENSGASAQ